MAITLFIIACATSVIGSICGIGGGVMIKPLLDAANIMSVSAISFLSGCTVLTMAVVSVFKNSINGKTKINKRTTPALAAGAVLGGVLGKFAFGYIKEVAGNENLIGLVQSVVLLLITAGTLVYLAAVANDKIITKRIENIWICGIIGVVLGMLSAFLGIGGGPINLAVLSYFFSMDTKEAATNSLFIILLSQVSSLLQAVVCNSIPSVDLNYLGFMMVGGVIGGLVGQELNKKIDEKCVAVLFDVLVVVVICISAYNIYRFSVIM